MITLDDVQITITKVIKPTARGILVSGHVDRGWVHAREVFQVHNAQPGATARVGRVYQDSRKVPEAQAGSDVRLLLERIEETEIHPGDRLLPGQKKDLRPAPQKYLSPMDEETWRQLPERIEPFLHPRQMAGKVAVLVLLGSVLIAGLLSVAAFFMKKHTPGFDAENLLAIGFLLIWCLATGFFARQSIREILSGLQGRKKFLQGSSQTVAQILRYKAVEGKSDYGPAYTYYLQLEFTPDQAGAALGLVRWKAQVSKRIYERLEGKTTINISYAIDDPRIFVLEGE